MAVPRNHASAGEAHRQFHAFFDGSHTSSSPSSSSNNRLDDMQFDIFEWYQLHQSCLRYFLDIAQYSGPVQATAAFMNVSLPFQKHPSPVVSFAPLSHTIPGGPAAYVDRMRNRPVRANHQPPDPREDPAITAAQRHVSLIPYLRRLVVTGLDLPGVLHGFFGDDWAAGVGPLHEQERRNYLFSAKSGGWAAVKKDYDMLPLETVPFMRPLRSPTDAEIEGAEKTWSEWLAMEDWMVGPRAPPEQMDEVGGMSQSGRGPRGRSTQH
jgi:hypothetical protein